MDRRPAYRLLIRCSANTYVDWTIASARRPVSTQLKTGSFLEVKSDHHIAIWFEICGNEKKCVLDERRTPLCSLSFMPHRTTRDHPVQLGTSPSDEEITVGLMTTCKIGVILSTWVGKFRGRES